ncbi:hypothetical protein RND81_02G159800 [Saponaria officinalis]|uniref:Uncharacterized protein n=1 Tax=Saponaria officinalis TaxID=3572 RepID=A0AAW1MUP9_SAPOF
MTATVLFLSSLLKKTLDLTLSFDPLSSFHSLLSKNSNHYQQSTVTYAITVLRLSPLLVRFTWPPLDILVGGPLCSVVRQAHNIISATAHCTSPSALTIIFILWSILLPSLPCSVTA